MKQNWKRKKQIKKNMEKENNTDESDYNENEIPD